MRYPTQNNLNYNNKITLIKVYVIILTVCKNLFNKYNIKTYFLLNKKRTFMNNNTKKIHLLRPNKLEYRDHYFIKNMS